MTTGSDLVYLGKVIELPVAGLYRRRTEFDIPPDFHETYEYPHFVLKRDQTIAAETVEGKVPDKNKVLVMWRIAYRREKKS